MFCLSFLVFAPSEINRFFQLRGSSYMGFHFGKQYKIARGPRNVFEFEGFSSYRDSSYPGSTVQLPPITPVLKI